MANIGGQLLTPEETEQRKVALQGSVIFEIKKNDFKGLA
jgi:hypothetical protein